MKSHALIGQSSRRRPTRARAIRVFAWPALVIGLLLLADVAVTQLWQEPITALLASHGQHELASELARLERSAPRTAVTHHTDLRRLLRSRARALARETRVGHPLGRIKMPSLGVSYVFVQGVDADSLTKGPGHYLRTTLPGGRGTVAIAGHRTTYLAPFRHIDSLRRGARIVVAMPYGTFVYRVEGKQTVLPSDSAVLDAGRDRLVLTACTPPFSAARRLVVTARLSALNPR